MQESTHMQHNFTSNSWARDLSIYCQIANTKRKKLSLKHINYLTEWKWTEIMLSVMHEHFPNPLQSQIPEIQEHQGKEVSQHRKDKQFFNKSKVHHLRAIF